MSRRSVPENPDWVECGEAVLLLTFITMNMRGPAPRAFDILVCEVEHSTGVKQE